MRAGVKGLNSRTKITAKKRTFSGSTENLTLSYVGHCAAISFNTDFNSTRTRTYAYYAESEIEIHENRTTER